MKIKMNGFLLGFSTILIVFVVLPSSVSGTPIVKSLALQFFGPILENFKGLLGGFLKPQVGGGGKPMKGDIQIHRPKRETRSDLPENRPQPIELDHMALKEEKENKPQILDHMALKELYDKGNAKYSNFYILKNMIQPPRETNDFKPEAKNRIDLSFNKFDFENDEDEESKESEEDSEESSSREENMEMVIEIVNGYVSSAIWLLDKLKDEVTALKNNYLDNEANMEESLKFLRRCFVESTEFMQALQEVLEEFQERLSDSESKEILGQNILVLRTTFLEAIQQTDFYRQEGILEMHSRQKRFTFFNNFFETYKLVFDAKKDLNSQFQKILYKVDIFGLYKLLDSNLVNLIGQPVQGFGGAIITLFADSASAFLDAADTTVNSFFILLTSIIQFPSTSGGGSGGHLESVPNSRGQLEETMKSPRVSNPRG